MDNRQKKKINIAPHIICFITSILLVVCIIIVISTLCTSSNSFPKGVYASIIVLFITALIPILYLSLTCSKDFLTKLYNSDSFTLYAISLIARKKLHNYTGVFLNIRDLKFVNSIASSVGGDKLLQSFSKTIRDFLVSGEVAARLGGDNFYVLIKKNRVNKFLALLDDIKVEIPIAGAMQTFVVKTRAGLYDIKEGDTIHEIMGNSSIALNFVRSSKDSNSLFYEDWMGEETYKDKEVTLMFDEAMKKDEFEVYYQPKVDASSNKLTGSEALARWIKNGEIVPPIKFVPALERAGLITRLDFFVFEQVCKDLKRWTDEGLSPVPVSSNFSRLHLKNPYFAENIMYILSRYKIDYSLIEIELTESAGFEDFEAFKRFIKTMNEAGIKVAIDDFGVGYSSLELLKDNNFNVIKIDKSFIDNIEVNDGHNPNAMLMSNIAHICHELNKEIVCEGVEFESQKKLLLDMDCNEIQGYLYDKPLPVDEYEKRLLSPSYKAD